MISNAKFLWIWPKNLDERWQQWRSISERTSNRIYLYYHRVSPPLKKGPDMLSEGNAAHPVGCDSPLHIVMAVWRPFCLNSNFLGLVWQPLLPIMVRLKAFSRIVCRGQERPNGRMGTLRPDFQANTRPRIFLKSQCHHKIQEDSCEEIQV